ncbi:hypothetical protein AB9E33_34080, partial [Rhizobium leguminosarum]|uniref:hypothetical protein n=1 Tax=Rhizobium leguminosarum TaxID=384 RepID=UPI003F974957
YRRMFSVHGLGEDQHCLCRCSTEPDIDPVACFQLGNQDFSDIGVIDEILYAKLSGRCEVAQREVTFIFPEAGVRGGG